MLGTRAVRGCLALLGLLLCPFCDSAESLPREYVAEIEDFDCIADWPKVGPFRIVNRLGKQAEAEAVARGESTDPYPIGTIIQLIWLEAMVKRGNGFDPESNDWEFFFLTDKAVPPYDKKVIDVRGSKEVVNRFGGNCFECHSLARDFDFICHGDHGCDPLPFSTDDSSLKPFQSGTAVFGDPTCRK